MARLLCAVDIPLGAAAPGGARRALAGLRGMLPPAVVEDLRLLASETVTSSLAGHPGAAEVRLRVLREPELTRLEIEGPAAAPPARAGAGDGLGRALVERVADRWGVRSGGDRLVWLELDDPVEAPTRADGPG